MPKARARVFTDKAGHVRSYTPKSTHDWEQLIRYQALEHRPSRLLDGPLSLEATFYLSKPKSKPKKVVYPDTKPDVDNLIKALADALEGIIYVNDSRIVDKFLHKRYGDPPRVEISIKEVSGA